MKYEICVDHYPQNGFTVYKIKDYTTDRNGVFFMPISDQPTNLIEVFMPWSRIVDIRKFED